MSKPVIKVKDLEIDQQLFNKVKRTVKEKGNTHKPMAARETIIRAFKLIAEEM